MNLEEAINLLNNMQKTIKESKILFDEPITVKLTENTDLAIEIVLHEISNLKKENEIKEKNYELAIKQNISYKQNLKDKIREWNESIKWNNADDCYYAIKILQELLEDK